MRATAASHPSIQLTLRPTCSDPSPLFAGFPVRAVRGQRRNNNFHCQETPDDSSAITGSPATAWRRDPTGFQANVAGPGLLTDAFPARPDCITTTLVSMPRSVFDGCSRRLCERLCRTSTPNDGTCDDDGLHRKQGDPGSGDPVTGCLFTKDDSHATMGCSATVRRFAWSVRRRGRMHRLPTRSELHDGIECTADSCDEENDECDHQPFDDWCSDGLGCNGRRAWADDVRRRCSAVFRASLAKSTRTSPSARTIPPRADLPPFYATRMAVCRPFAAILRARIARKILSTRRRVWVRAESRSAVLVSRSFVASPTAASIVTPESHRKPASTAGGSLRAETASCAAASTPRSQGMGSTRDASTTCRSTSARSSRAGRIATDVRTVRRRTVSMISIAPSTRASRGRNSSPIFAFTRPTIRSATTASSAMARSVACSRRRRRS